jgi:hypothetical protein
MQNTWLSLAWKEWHEHKWKLAAMLATLWGVTSLVIWQERAPDRFGLAFGMLFLCSVPMAVFIGLSAAANERSRRTMPFLQALPVPMWRVATVKLVCGFLTIFAAVVATIALFLIWEWIFDQTGINYRSPTEEGIPVYSTGVWPIDAVLYFVPLIASLFVWSAATGVNRRDEVAAGVVALVAIVGAWGLLFVVYHPLERYGHRIFEAVVLSMAPGGFFIVATDGGPMSRYVSIGAVVAIVVHAALIARYIRRFGQIADAGRRSPQVVRPVIGEWLGSPRSSALTAIVWKQFRETVPIAIAGLVVIVGTVTFLVFGDRSLRSLADVYQEVALVIGFGIALVAGIGVSLFDSEPRLNTFWRTRPVNPDLWFAVKFLTGLAVVLAAIYTPLLIVEPSIHEQENNAYRAITPASFHVALFAAAVATTCLVRHAIYAAVLSLGVFTACVAGAWLIWDLACKYGFTNLSGEESRLVENPGVLLAGASFCFFVSTLLAWSAMRYDWGLKSRY